jgi:peptidyl-prolyl cis-trans isomerase A (cyclophilin A)
MTVCNKRTFFTFRTVPAAALLFGSLILGVSGCGGQENSGGPEININAPAAAPSGGSTLVVPDAKAPGDAKTEDASKPAAAKEEKITKVPVIIDTSMGKIEAELDGEKAPITVKNFLSYVKKKHYDGTIFHRVIPGFMIQGGGLTTDMEEKPTDSPIKNEHNNGLKNLRGTLSMARTSDPDSATDQFFISVNDNDSLDEGDGYAVFGKVTKGMDVADKIVAVPTTSKGPHDDVPVEPVIIKSIRVKEGAGK